MTVIRQAAIEDEAAVIELLKQLLLPSAEAINQDRYDWQRVAQTFRDVVADTGKGAVLVADEDGDLIGMITLSYPTAIRFSGKYASIEEFITAQQARGKGIGSQLLTAAITEARAKGCHEIQVNNPSKAGYPVYVRQDFEDIGKHLRLRILDETT